MICVLLFYVITFIIAIPKSDARVTRKLVTEKNPETRVSPHVTRGNIRSKYKIFESVCIKFNINRNGD